MHSVILFSIEKQCCDLEDKNKEVEKVNLYYLALTVRNVVEYIINYFMLMMCVVSM